MKLRHLIIFAWCCITGTAVAYPPAADSITVYKIWDKAPHNAFPDLFLFKNEFYCSFREAGSHVDNTNSGKVRIIKSADGKNWKSVALFEIGEGVDVREARLSVTPEGRMMAIVAGGVFKDGQYLMLAPYVSFSDASGESFSPLQKVMFGDGITPGLDWIWRVTWHRGTGYGVMYSAKYEMVGGKRNRSMSAQVVSTRDGKHFERVSPLDIDGSPNESTIRFDKKDRMYVLIRRETEDQMGALAESAPPYRDWTYHRLAFRLGGPNFLFLDDKKLLIGSRLHEGKSTSTALHLTDLRGKAIKTTKLPSSGDNSYPGMVIHKKKLWVAYYSSHEGKSAIYLTSIPLKDLQ